MQRFQSVIEPIQPRGWDCNKSAMEQGWALNQLIIAVESRRRMLVQMEVTMKSVSTVGQGGFVSLHAKFFLISWFHSLLFQLP